MRASEAIVRLEELIELYGDLDLDVEHLQSNRVCLQDIEEEITCPECDHEFSWMIDPEQIQDIQDELEAIDITTLWVDEIEYTNSDKPSFTLG